MKEANRVRKNEIKYNVTLNEEQKEAKRLIRENQIVVITGRAGCGKSLVAAQTALDFLEKGEAEEIFVTRSAIETGRSLGFLPGGLDEKFDPYIEALQENLKKCIDPLKIDKYIKDQKIKALPVQFIRGKTIEEVLIVEEAQNLTKHEMLAILTRLGKTGKIIVNGDLDQQDIHVESAQNGLRYMIELAKKIDGIEYIKLKANHRSDLVGAILDHEYSKTNNAI